MMFIGTCLGPPTIWQLLRKPQRCISVAKPALLQLDGALEKVLESVRAAAELTSPRRVSISTPALCGISLTRLQ